MKAGRLRDIVIFPDVSVQQAPSGEVETDRFGNPKPTTPDPAPGTGLKVRANVRETLGKEKLEAGRLEDQRTATLRVRRSAATSAISINALAQFRGDDWDVKSVVGVDDGTMWLDILCELRG